MYAAQHPVPPASPQRWSRLCPGFLASVALTLLVATIATFPAGALPLNLSLVNLQPVNAESWVDMAYDPTLATTQVLFEPIQPSVLTIPSYRTNMDFEVQNDEASWLRLDGIRVEYMGSSVSDLVVSQDELVGYGDSFYLYPPSNPDKKRPAIVNGGFGATGMILQRGLDKAHNLPFGRALDVAAYTPPGSSPSYAVVGKRQFYLGEPPVDPWDPVTLVDSAFLARYDTNGKLVSYRTFQGSAMGAVATLGGGLFLAVGLDVGTIPGQDLMEVLSVRRLKLYDLDDDGNAISTTQITTDESFGDAGLRQIGFEDTTGKPCDIRRVVGATAVTPVSGPRYLVAAALDCSSGDRAGLAMLDGDGDLVASFGDQGTLVLEGPGGGSVTPVAIERRRGVGLGTFAAWLAAKTGDTCFSGSHQDCLFGLTRLTQTGQDGAYGWTEITFPEADNAIPEDMAVDSAGRVFIGGTATAGNVTYAALARFTKTGVLDAGFGENGLVGTLIGGRDARITGLAMAKGNQVAAALTILHEAAETTTSFGAARFSGSSGALLWSRDSLQEGTQWQHNLPGEDLNYGSYLEADVEGAPQAIAVDDQDRFVAVGAAVSALIAETSWAGPTSIALARYLPFGEVHSRRWVQPGATLKIVVPEDRIFPFPAPEKVGIQLDFEGGTEVDWYLERDVLPLAENAVISNPAPGGYLFPIPPSELAFDEAAVAGGHPLSHHHRHSSGNRFAYDLGMARWDGAHWDGYVQGATDLWQNDAFLVWNRQVRAMADGQVVACRRSSLDNDPGSISGRPANFVKIQHAFDAFDKSRREFVSYLHLRQNTIPLSICPNICPEDNPDCDLSTEGVDPDGRSLPTPVDVTAGDIIGRVGNSGTSTNPHLHVHLSTGAGGEAGDPVAGNVPLLFQSILLGNRFDGAGVEIEPSPWYGAHNVALPHRYLVIPTE